MDTSQQSPTVMCPGCGSPNEEQTHFCTKCGAPLTWHATTDPLSTVFAEGYAARRAVGQPHKRIIIVGLWLWMLPVFVISVGTLVGGLVFFLEGLITLHFENTVSGLIAAGVSAVFLSFSGPMLYKGTKNYLRGRRHKSTQRQSPGATRQQTAVQAPETDSEKPLFCLACGQAIPGDAIECPACGWSYKDG
jgi:hypothetical protein